MFIDSSRIADGSLLDFDCCICGGGAAGLTIALDLIGSGVRTCVLESGSFRRERSTQDLYSGRNVSRIYDDDGGSFQDYLRSTRSRYLGGSSNCWGGWCRPFDDIDFARREWVPYSGWPISRSELLSFYERAHKVLQLGPFTYDRAHWQAAIGSQHFQTLPFDKFVCDAVFQFHFEYPKQQRLTWRLTCHIVVNIRSMQRPNCQYSSELKNPPC